MSKYRPPQPILTLVVPQLKNDGFKWHLEGRDTARRCLIQRGLLPVLAAPSQGGACALCRVYRSGYRASFALARWCVCPFAKSTSGNNHISVSAAHLALLAVLL